MTMPKAFGTATTLLGIQPEYIKNLQDFESPYIYKPPVAFTHLKNFSVKRTFLSKDRKYTKNSCGITGCATRIHCN